MSILTIGWRPMLNSSLLDWEEPETGDVRA